MIRIKQTQVLSQKQSTWDDRYEWAYRIGGGKAFWFQGRFQEKLYTWKDSDRLAKGETENER